jgi:ABC-type cobalamin/Fe3+-siderophores transport system ATPase subunit
MDAERACAQVDLTLKNYRCFPDSKPARISLRSGLTALVGVNNSGKSSLLKFFYEFRPLFQMLSTPTGNLINALKGDAEAFSPGRSVIDNEEVFSNLNSRDLQVELRLVPPNGGGVPPALPSPSRLVLTVLRGTNTWVAKLYLGDDPVEVGNGNIGLAGTQLRSPTQRLADLTGLFDVCKALSQALYVGPFRNAINVGVNEDYFDIQVGQAFIKQWRELKTGKVKRQNEAAYRLTEDIKGIFRFGDLEINPSPDDTTLQVFIDGRSYRLPELGSGLTQFILVFANAAVRQPSYILIDEPELNLHPSLQLDFLTTLGSYARDGVVFGTHSIGLARAAADRIYSFRSVAEGESEVSELERTPRLSEFLGELSFSGYRELGFDRVLLVEGVTDVRTVQQFLRLHKKDHQVVILPAGGSQMIAQGREAELEEIKRISENVCAVIDSERLGPEAPLDPPRAAFVEACQRAKIRCHVLERRAIENYLLDRAMKMVKGDKYRALEPYESLKEVSPAWSKQENWRIAREMTLEELEGTDLGEFVASL